MKRHHLVTMLLSAAFLAAYWGLCTLGSMIGEATAHETSLWGGAGLCLFMAYTFGLRLAPAIAVGSFAHIYVTQGSAPMAAIIALSMVGGAVGPAALMRRLGFEPRMGRLADVSILVMAGLLPASFIGAMLGVPLMIAAKVFPESAFPAVFGDWVVGSLLGSVWIAPFLFIWSSSRPRRPTRARLLELLGLSGALTVFFYLFFKPEFGNLRESTYLIRPHTLFPFFVWAALRFRQHGATTLALVTGSILVAAITMGNAPFARLSTGQNFDYLQNFISTLSLTSLFLAAAVSQYDEAHASLRAMFDHSGAGHARLDPKTGRFVEVNRKLSEILGFEPRELRGRRFVDVTYAPDLNDSAANFQMISTGAREAVDFEKRYVRKDGRIIWVQVTATLIRDTHGRPLSVIAVFHDVTGRKSVEDEQRKAKEAADAANLSKTQFVANMSHEIRTPLGAILGFNEFSFDPHQTWEDRLHCADKIQENGELLKRVIDDVLDLAKVEAGRFEVQRSSFELPELIDGVRSLLELKAMGKPVRIEVLSDGPVPRRVHSDPERLRQILINVAGNALKFTESGHVRIVLRHVAREAPAAAMLEITVEDTGIGMTEAEAGRIFRPFQQGDATTTRRYGGSGLGLALARRFAEALGGDVVLTRTEPGVGSVFTCRVESGATQEQEFYVHAAKAGSAVRRAGARADRGERLKGRHILLADDSADNRALVRRFLEREGATVEQAENGREAVEMALTTAYDAVLLDIQMPHLDGLEATRILRSSGFKQPILALTAHAMREDRLRTLDAGCDDHIAKPIDPRTLVAAVERHMATTAQGV